MWAVGRRNAKYVQSGHFPFHTYRRAQKHIVGRMGLGIKRRLFCKIPTKPKTGLTQSHFGWDVVWGYICTRIFSIPYRTVWCVLQYIGIVDMCCALHSISNKWKRKRLMWKRPLRGRCWENSRFAGGFRNIIERSINIRISHIQLGSRWNIR